MEIDEREDEIEETAAPPGGAAELEADAELEDEETDEQ
jgi:hypothetical protein